MTGFIAVIIGLALLWQLRRTDFARAIVFLVVLWFLIVVVAWTMLAQ